MIKGFLGGCLERFGSENFRARGKKNSRFEVAFIKKNF
jgi:hypothetical protein